MQVIRLDLTQDRARQQAVSEVRTLYESQQHAGIVQYYNSYFDAGMVVIMMELMEGGSLADVLRRHGALSEAHLVELAHQV